MNLRYKSGRLVLHILTIGLTVITTMAFTYYKSGLPDREGITPVPAAVPQRVSIVNGLTMITLDTATQVQSGLLVESLSTTTHRTETTVYGTVLDLQPLFDLRTRFMSTQADVDTAKAVVAVSRQEYERNRILYQDNQNISLKTYQAAQAAYLADKAKVNAVQRISESIRGAVRQQFGEPLGHWTLDPHSPQFEKLLNRQEVLLRISLPAGDPIQATNTIQIAANNTQRLPAYLVSPSPQNDPVIQGNAFIYRTAAPIAAGTNIVAYLPTSHETTEDIFIPARAIVWYGGQPWVYVQTAPDRFARRPIARHAPLQGGFFVNESIKAGERVVVSGAQLLLSEELRPPPGSSACKDPECD
ncbi:RND-type multidrug efflux pump, membrane permease [Candidatus Nitrotoga sp. HW29]|uniref:hypothetical protein n=1 Tax=Candidatus Nitrotoga sp. HW29 TaxID=2886963 RepID=UPI001EF2F831|nr:hypothetical protein [Candidatus Nitrotoga sp. HW29]CAH1905679.1 RND-type multidrug efflux pump, membrane permease [Candidatus Nitrotoga sp. HW29]